MKRNVIAVTGNTIVEYGFILALVCVVCLGALFILGEAVDMKYNFISGAIGKAQSAAGVVAKPGIVVGGGGAVPSKGTGTGTGTETGIGILGLTANESVGDSASGYLPGKAVSGLGNASSSLDGPALQVAGSDGQTYTTGKPAGTSGFNPGSAKKPLASVNAGFATEEVSGTKDDIAIDNGDTPNDPDPDKKEIPPPESTLGEPDTQVQPEK